MSDTTVGLLHPGEMGAAVGQCLAAAGHRVLWVPEGRSAASAARAEAAGLTAACGGLAGLVREADVILSVCPPHAAVGVALEVAAAQGVAAQGMAAQGVAAGLPGPGARFGGVYVDANAVSPTTAGRSPG
jgi:3-hydroxyisobutyrate dehydrogenase-like beta-hydroxyacid dehydrogenase